MEKLMEYWCYVTIIQTSIMLSKVYPIDSSFLFLIRSHSQQQEYSRHCKQNLFNRRALRFQMKGKNIFHFDIHLDANQTIFHGKSRKLLIVHLSLSLSFLWITWIKHRHNNLCTVWEFQLFWRRRRCKSWNFTTIASAPGSDLNCDIRDFVECGRHQCAVHEIVINMIILQSDRFTFTLWIVCWWGICFNRILIYDSKWKRNFLCFVNKWKLNIFVARVSNTSKKQLFLHSLFLMVIFITERHVDIQCDRISFLVWKNSLKFHSSLPQKMVRVMKKEQSYQILR